MVIVLPAVLFFVLLLAQAAVWAYATHIAQATAAHALSATRVHGGSTADGRAEADYVLDQLGRGPLRSPHVTVQRGADRAEVGIDGHAIPVLPFLQLPVKVSAAGPVEEFTEAAP